VLIETIKALQGSDRFGPEEEERWLSTRPLKIEEGEKAIIVTAVNENQSI